MRLMRGTDSVHLGRYKLPDVCGNCILQPPDGSDLIYTTHPPNLMSPSRAPLPPINAAHLITAQEKRQFIAHWAELNKGSPPNISNTKSPVKQCEKSKLKSRQHSKHKEIMKPSEAQVFQISVKTGLEALNQSIPEPHRKLGKVTSTKLKPIPPTPINYNWSRYLPNGAYTGPLTRYTSTNQQRLQELQKPRPCSIHMPKVDYMMYEEDPHSGENSSAGNNSPQRQGRVCADLFEEGPPVITIEGRDSVSQARPPSLVPDTDDWLDRHKRKQSLHDRMQRVQEWLFE